MGVAAQGAGRERAICLKAAWNGHLGSVMGPLRACFVDERVIKQVKGKDERYCNNDV